MQTFHVHTAGIIVLLCFSVSDVENSKNNFCNLDSIVDAIIYIRV